MVARVRSQVKYVGSVVDKVELVQVFFEYFGLPCQFLVHQILHTRLRTGTLGQLVANTPSGLSIMPPHKIKKKKVEQNKL
jgi:hypothetical protein